MQIQIQKSRLEAVAEFLLSPHTEKQIRGHEKIGEDYCAAGLLKYKGGFTNADFRERIPCTCGGIHTLEGTIICMNDFGRFSFAEIGAYLKREAVRYDR